MPCRQASTFNGVTGSGQAGGGGFATEADCLQACKEGACCEGSTCTVKPQCQCQGTGQTFKGVGTTCAGTTNDSCCRLARVIAINVTFEGYTECLGTGQKLYVSPFSVTAMPFNWQNTVNSGYPYYVPGGNSDINDRLNGLQFLPVTHSFPAYNAGNDSTARVPVAGYTFGDAYTTAFVGFELRQTPTDLTFRVSDAKAYGVLSSQDSAKVLAFLTGQSGAETLPASSGACGRSPYYYPGSPTVRIWACDFTGGGRIGTRPLQSKPCSDVSRDIQWDWIVGAVYEHSYTAPFMDGRNYDCAPTFGADGQKLDGLPGFRYYGKLSVDSIQYLTA